MFNKKSNEQILRKKPYDILVKRNEHNLNLFEYWASYKNIYTDKETNCFISFVDKSKTFHQTNISSFRSSLNWFEDYKKQHNGYNNWFEKIVAYIKGY